MARGPFTTANFLELTSVVVNQYPITMACWLYPTATSAQRALVVQGDSLDYCGLDINNLQVRMAATITGRFGGGNAVVNQWNSAVGIINSQTDGAIFVNGVKTSSAIVQGPITNALRQNIGARRLSSIQIAFEGYISRVAIWSTGLTDAQAGSFSDGCSPLQIQPQSLKLYRPEVLDNIDLKGSVWSVSGTVGSFGGPPVYGY